jgi:hypothetical protein
LYFLLDSTFSTHADMSQGIVAALWVVGSCHRQLMLVLGTPWTLLVDDYLFRRCHSSFEAPDLTNWLGKIHNSSVSVTIILKSYQQFAAGQSV